MERRKPGGKERESIKDVSHRQPTSYVLAAPSPTLTISSSTNHVQANWPISTMSNGTVLYNDFGS